MTATIGMDEDGLASAPTDSLVIELFLVVVPETTGNAVMKDEEFDNKLVNTVYEVLFEKLPSKYDLTARARRIFPDLAGAYFKKFKK